METVDYILLGFLLLFFLLCIVLQCISPEQFSDFTNSCWKICCCLLRKTNNEEDEGNNSISVVNDEITLSQPLLEESDSQSSLFSEYGVDHKKQFSMILENDSRKEFYNSVLEEQAMDESELSVVDENNTLVSKSSVGDTTTAAAALTETPVNSSLCSTDEKEESTEENGEVPVTGSSSMEDPNSSKSDMGIDYL